MLLAKVTKLLSLLLQASAAENCSVGKGVPILTLQALQQINKRRALGRRKEP